jgi:peptidoglycan/LPS O-acetylase OafA/YrhL
MGRMIALALSLALLLVTGVVGIYNGITERSTGATTWQKSVTAGVFLYGLLGLVSAYGLARRRKWSVPAVISWGVVITYVAAVASVAYTEKDAHWSTALAAGAASALIAVGVVWTARAMSREGITGSDTNRSPT